MKKVVLASNNKKKIEELQALLTPQNWHIVTQGELSIPEADEVGKTFVENALIKARHASKLANMPALADDSGLVVDALAGSPGIYSARYAGLSASDADNNRKLLTTLAECPADRRTAHFHCTLIWLNHAAEPDPLICQGRWYGSILDAPRGQNGFGYDPLFWIDHLQRSAAELSASEKGMISHRGKAIQHLAKALSGEPSLRGSLWQG